MNNNKITEGQEVYYQYFSHRPNESREPIATTVTKVGRKWFEVEAAGFTRFDVNTLKNDGKGYQSSSRIILSLLEYKNEKEYKSLHNHISDYFGTWPKHKTTLQQLRQIAQVLNNEQNDKSSDTTNAT